MSAPLISNIQRFSVDDGPGIRTTVFLKGCNLSCRWCHNPECISFGPSLQLIERSCTSCGRCVASCPNGVHEVTAAGEHLLHRDRCTACGKCVFDCFHTALALIGEVNTPRELVNKLVRDREYFKTSGGGVTISGGDPLLFPAYTAEVLRRLQEEGIHTAVDTAGCVPWAHFQQVMPWTDLFLYDVKAFSPALHRELTGVDNFLIWENLRALSGAGGRIFVRVPVIPGCNDSREELDAIAGLLAALPTPPELCQLLPYHSYGAGKYATLGLKDPLGVLSPPDASFMEEMRQEFSRRGLNAAVS